MSLPRQRLDPIRVVVIDDSPTVRAMLTAILQAERDIQVVGMAADGEDGVRIVQRLRPDVITMDINMPRLNGLEATRRIMRETPTPIVVISGSLMHVEVDLTFEAMQAGALTVVRTPGLHDPETCRQVVRAVRLMSDVAVVRHWGPPALQTGLSAGAVQPAALRPGAAKAAVPPLPLPPDLSAGRSIQLIGIASSTGGPGTLATVLQPLPANFPAPILVVQHITNGFATGLAEWLNSQITLRVGLAVHGELPEPGSVLIAPDDYHMLVNARGEVELSRDPPVHTLRPCANYLFDAMARNFGPRAAGVILTGMGDDGVDGLEKMHRAGALVAAQDEASCVVYGMPREAVLRGVVDWVLTPEQIPGWLMQVVHPSFRTRPARADKVGGR